MIQIKFLFLVLSSAAMNRAHVIRQRSPVNPEARGFVKKRKKEKKVEQVNQLASFFQFSLSNVISKLPQTILACGST